MFQIDLIVDVERYKKYLQEKFNELPDGRKGYVNDMISAYPDYGDFIENGSEEDIEFVGDLLSNSKAEQKLEKVLEATLNFDCIFIESMLSTTIVVCNIFESDGRTNVICHSFQNIESSLAKKAIKILVWTYSINIVRGDSDFFHDLLSI